MKKIIIVVLTIVVAGALLVYINKPKKVLAPSTTQQTQTAEEVKTAAWNTFTQYVAALKSHNLAQVTTLSYQLSDTCKDPKQQTACFQKMDAVYAIAQNFKEETFTHVLFDDKQIILQGDWRIIDSPQIFGEARESIFFTRKPDGTPQVLYFFQPEEVVYTSKTATDTQASLLTKLAPQIKDSDMDGVEDIVETCSYPGAPKTCIKTDPNKKDSNGNGWWDSTETWFYTK